MTETITPPEWLTVGAQVAVVSYGVGGGVASLKTVDRLTATTVVVDGDRYRLDALRRSTSTYGPTYYLRDPSEPEVIAILRRTATERMAEKAETALRNWRRAKFDPKSTAAVRDALAALAPYLPPEDAP